MKNTNSSWLAELATAVRESTMKRLRVVPPGQENWRPTPDSLSFAEIAQHLIDTDEWLFAKLADPQLSGIEAVAGTMVIETRSHYDWLLERLFEIGQQRTELLNSLTEAELQPLIPDDRFGGTVSVWWVIVRGNLDHEAHHRGQLATYLRVLRSTPSEEEGVTTVC